MEFKSLAKFGGIGLVLGMMLLPILMNIYAQVIYAKDTHNWNPVLDSTLGQLVSPEKIIYEQSLFLSNVTLKQQLQEQLPSQIYTQIIADTQTKLIDALGIFILVIFGLSYLVTWIAGWREENILKKIIAVLIVIFIIYPILIMLYNVLIYQTFFPPYFIGLKTFIMNFGEIFKTGILATTQNIEGLI